MTAKPCVICGKSLDGWVYNNKDATHKYEAFQSHTVGFQCEHCGAAICEYKHLKEIKYSQFSGYYKVICPNCGKPMGLFRYISDREVSNLTPVEVPSTNLETWADIFIDTNTGERLLKAATYGISLKLVLTNRRLIALTSAAYLNQDPFNFVIPLTQIAAVRTEKKIIGTIALLVDTKAGESIKFEGEGSVELFGQAILAALPSASPAVVFPMDEQVYYEGDNLKFIWNSNFGSEIGQEMHEKRFYNTLRMTLAVTNHRMFFYRISNVAAMTGSHAYANVTYGEPRLQFISIPWEKIQRVSYGGSFLEKGMHLVLTTPVWGHDVPWLKAYPDEQIKVEEYSETCAKCGGVIVGGVGTQRKSKDGSLIEASQTGWHCPTCHTSYHHDKKCRPSKEKCPVCKQPMQAIDRAYSKLILGDQAIAASPFMAAQIFSPVAPMGESGKEWNMPITSDMKGWETQVLPAVRHARPSLIISGK